MTERFEIAADDGHTIHAQITTPTAAPVGIIQILHGLGEYVDRYARFGEAATARGFVVVGHDHRGHGGHGEEPGYFAAKNGFHRLTEDALRVQEAAAERFPGLPITLLGHSMGSYIAQHFAMVHGGRLRALLLSGSTRPSGVLLRIGLLLAHIECWRLGDRFSSKLLDKLFFGDFNKAFKPARTPNDWLSRDPDEVDGYVADPLCGGPYTAGLWRDLMRGLIEIRSDNALLRIPSDLPIMITGGADDPVGGEKGMGDLALHYAQTSHQRLKIKIYEGGRHEMLNETNRDEVTKDWLDWIASHP